MFPIRSAAPSSRAEVDVRACLTALGPGDDLVGGVALLGVTPPGHGAPIDAVLVLPRGVLVVGAVDLPGPAVRVEAPLDGPWVVDGWRLALGGGAQNPAGRVLAAAAAVEARLRAPGAVPLRTLVTVGPYVRTLVQPPADVARGVRMLTPTWRAFLAEAIDVGRGVARCDETAATALVRALAPDAVVPPGVLAAEGFARAAGDGGPDRVSRARGQGR